jgi:hypothetical protein
MEKDKMTLITVRGLGTFGVLSSLFLSKEDKRVVAVSLERGAEIIRQAEEDYKRAASERMLTGQAFGL